jgi:hypothetical protein
MKELINLVINTLGEMDNNDSVKIIRKNDNEYCFQGVGEDDSKMKYKYEISVKYMPFEEEQEEFQMSEKQIQLMEEMKQRLHSLEIQTKLKESNKTTEGE